MRFSPTRRFPLLGLLAGALLAAGCQTPEKRPGSPPPTPPTIGDPRSVPLFGGDPATRATHAQLVAAAAGADVFIIGENHGHPLGLALAAALWEDLLPRAPLAALALEFFERDDQAHIDDYLAGLTDEKSFRGQTGRTPANYPDGHRQMVEAAKSAGRRVWAANAPRVYVRTARTASLDRLSGLTPEQRRLFRLPDFLIAGPYRQAYDQVMRPMLQASHRTAPHAGAAATGAATAGTAPANPPARTEADQLDAFYRSQSLWDWNPSPAQPTPAAARSCSSSAASIATIAAGWSRRSRTFGRRCAS